MKLKLKIIVGIALTSFVVTVGSVIAGTTIFLKRNADATAESNSGLNGKLSSALGGDQGKVLGVSDVAIHNTSADCWIIIDGSIYEVTNFLNSHPGGAFTITPYCGKDASNAFKTKDKKPASPHSQMAINMLSQYFLAKVGQKIVSLPTPTSTPTALPSPTPVKTIVTSGTMALSAASIATHNTPADCWLIISGKVYNVTSFLNSHPGGAFTITPYCGKEATNAFNTKDKNPATSHSSYAQSLLANYLVGSLGATVSAVLPTPKPVPTPTAVPVPTPAVTNQTLTTATVATHNTTADCWLIISNNVYNVTSYLVMHPGGIGVIQPYCGQEATNAFQTKGGRGSNHSQNAYNLLNSYLVGSIGATVTTTPASSPVPGSVPTPTPTSRRRDDD